jgi:hypothetical protein
MNVTHRMTNFLPQTPYGMTALIPAETPLDGRFKRIITTDGEYFYDETGKQYRALEYKPAVLKALKEAALKMPLLVKGNVHWSAVRLNETHLRITLIDPGYLDPAARTAQIIFQHVEAKTCTDILSKESLPIVDGKVELTIPAGVFRVVDVEI